MISQLSDKGSEMKQKLIAVRHEIALRRCLESLDGNMKELTLDAPKKVDLREKKVKKSSGKKKSEPAQSIPLAKSTTLQVEQANLLPVSGKTFVLTNCYFLNGYVNRYLFMFVVVAINV